MGAASRYHYWCRQITSYCTFANFWDPSQGAEAIIVGVRGHQACMLAGGRQNCQVKRKTLNYRRMATTNQKEAFGSESPHQA